MEAEFMDWANGISLGAAIIFFGIIIGIVTVAVRSICKLSKAYKDYVLLENKKKESDDKLHEDVKQLSDTISNIESLIKSTSEENSKRITVVENSLEEYKKNSQDVTKTIDRIDGVVTLLVDSDKEDIKSYIVNQYHKWMDLGYIDLYAYETILVRYDKYKKEHGNSFVGKLIEELEQLEKRSFIKPKK